MTAVTNGNDRAALSEQRLRDYAREALESEARSVATTADGEGRNPRLNEAAFAVGQIIGAAPAALSRDEAERRLLEAAAIARQPAARARDTIRRGLQAGIARPRDLSGVAVEKGRPRRSGPAASAAPGSLICLPDDQNRSRAAEMWHNACPALGTAAEMYLRSRGIVGELPPSLRFRRDVAMPDSGHHPCLIAAVTVPTTGELIAAQRTALRNDGSAKAAIEPAKAALGGTRGGAVVLGELASGEAIIEGEGVETVLSCCDAIGWPGIATLSCDALGKPPLPPGRPVVIVVDRGAEAKARVAAGRRHAEGRAVRFAFVPVDVRTGERGVDANDVLRDLGHDAVRAMIEAAVPYRPDPLPPAPLPDGFGRLANGWITYTTTVKAKTREGVEEIENEVPLCSPLEILAASRDSDGRSAGRLVRVRNLDGQWAETALPMAWLAGDGREMRQSLLSLGLEIAPGAGSRAALARLIGHTPEARARCVARLGWHGQAFVLPDTIIGDTAGERIVWQPEVRVSHAYCVGGTLDGWRTTVAARAVGSSRLVLALSTAFAAPLLGLLGIENGGFHFRGSSSIGKTTLLRVAGSVWGGGRDGYIRRWKATANGLEGVATLHSDSLLCLDELAEIEARDAYRAGYMLANGQGKQRAGHGGEARPTATWRLLFLSAGELSLSDKIAEDGRRATAGQEVRVVDLQADAGARLGLFECLDGAVNADTFARELNEATATHHGHAARAYLDAIGHDLDRAVGLARAVMRAFEAEHVPADAAGQVRRVLARFALVAAAGELAARYGVLPWQAGEATAGVARCCRDWLAARGGAGNQEADRAIAQVRAHIEAHGSSCFEPLTGPPSPVRDRVGFVGIGPDGGRRWYVLSEAWRKVCAGIDPKLAARALAERGMLEHDVGTHQLRAPAAVQRSLGGGKRTRVYAITAALFDGSGRDDG